MAKPHVGGGRIPIELDGKQLELVPSLEACIEVSRIAGGINAAAQRCAALNFETICAIVGAGLEIDGNRLNPGQRDKLVPKAVFEAGLVGVSATCIRFCRVIANGGREPTPEEDENDEDESQEGAADDGPLGSATSSSTSESTDEPPAG